LLAGAVRGIHLDWVFLTHIHLDHAGGAGLLAIHHPEATFVVHPSGVRHLANPTRLIDAVRAANPRLFPLYGRPRPIPAERLYGCADGETFDLGHGVAIEAVYTPGHAPHHVCFLECSSHRLFAGDAVGHHAVPVDLPLTVPPRFDMKAALASLQRLRGSSVRQIAFTHYGIADDGKASIEAYARRLSEWMDEIAERSRVRTSEEIAEHVLGEPRFRNLSDVGRELVRMCVDGAVASIKEREAA
jgi:glyoxylase-like metal-dependent hydrolase (beta-lactamase superfamily II)